MVCVRETHTNAEVQRSVFISAPQWAAEPLLVEALITVLPSLPSHPNCFHSSSSSNPLK